MKSTYIISRSVCSRRGDCVLRSLSPLRLQRIPRNEIKDCAQPSGAPSILLPWTLARRCPDSIAPSYPVVNEGSRGRGAPAQYPSFKDGADRRGRRGGMIDRQTTDEIRVGNTIKTIRKSLSIRTLNLKWHSLKCLRISDGGKLRCFRRAYRASGFTELT
ncbi:hypothetical protein EVAR_12997_1 [Eumeta japonica]|uniref:Uncharacterized protein n=1 Tax=Eumeta variegata TaxID=151549 RepID=A0A4C1TY56_EUMVA|nr:hypothetical protein EVAR_12997_1 [Eumeta japonica]